MATILNPVRENVQTELFPGRRYITPELEARNRITVTVAARNLIVAVVTVREE
jgi:hypothetical protein